MSLAVALSHRFEGFALDVAFRAPAGITALFGHSGAGKTTVVNAIAGLMRPERGRIAVGDHLLLDTAQGVCLPAHCRGVGYVFQDARLFPHLRVRGNLDYGRRARRLPFQRAHWDRVIALLGIGDLLERRPASLSGGERQRIAIGRALLARPWVLLLDEPLAALDEARKGEILPYLEQLRDEARVPILYVSHSLAEIARLATTVVVLAGGRVRCAAPVARVLSDPALVPALGLREAGALLAARLVAHSADGLSQLQTAGGTLWLPHVQAAVGQMLRVRILARDVILALTPPQGLSALNVLSGHVLVLHAGSGPGVMVQIACGEDRILARITRRSAQGLGLTAGQAIYAIIKSVSVAQGNIGRGNVGHDPHPG